jgi:hypothetical protein
VVPSDLQDITATTETVLAVIDAEGPDAVSFLGDLVGNGANSNAMVAHNRDRGITIMPDQACMRLRPGSSTSYALDDNLPHHLADEGQGWSSHRSPDLPFMTDPAVFTGMERISLRGRLPATRMARCPAGAPTGRKAVGQRRRR